MKNIIHLHNHTEYSVLDGYMTISEMINRTKELGCDSVAITDHGNISGWYEFNDECISQEIKPIFGCEFYITDNKLNKTKEEGKKPYTHLVLLAKDQEGLSNLIKLSTIASIEGFYYKPRIEFNDISKYGKGLIGLSACIGGTIPTLLLQGKSSEAKDLALMYNSCLDGFYLEIQPQDIDEQRLVNPLLMAMSREIDIPIVICNDAHYAYEKDAEYHRYLYLIATHKTLADKVEGFKEKGYWLKSTKEMAESFLQFHPQLIQDYRKELISGMEMTQEITNQCTATLTIRDIQVPKVSEDPDKLLIDLTAEGWKKKIVPLLGKVDRDMYYCRGDIYQERVRRELKAIQEYGVSGYFLVIKDLVDYAKSVGIQTGYGRGSVAGSLVAYLLDITEVDPLKFDLLFERFLSPGREGVELPDIDLDFEHTRRDELIAYLGKRWGEANVANIVTYNHMGARQALKDVGGIFGHTTKDMNEVTSSIGVETLEEALVGNLILLEFANKYPEEIRVARALEGRIKSVSRHAAGVVVSPVSLIEVCPLMRATGGDHIITQWDMHSVAKAGLIKIDVLGLKCLSVIRETVDLIKKKNPEFSISRMSISDKKVFDQFCIGRTVGIFQCERGEYQEVLRKIKPRFISDLALVTSLVRPGSKEQIDSFIDNRKHLVRWFILRLFFRKFFLLHMEY